VTVRCPRGSRPDPRGWCIKQEPALQTISYGPTQTGSIRPVRGSLGGDNYQGLMEVPIARNGITCGVGFTPASVVVGGIQVVRVIRYASAGYRYGAIIEDLQTRKKSIIPLVLDLARLIPHAACAELLAEVLSPAQTPDGPIGIPPGAPGDSARLRR
jgi:hypothetical protein